MTPDRNDWSEERLARLLAATRSEADPRTLARALERLRERDAEPAWIEWAGRPAALVASCALLVASLVVGGLLLDGASGTSGANGDVITSLVGEDASLGLDAGEAAPAAPVDSEATP